MKVLFASLAGLLLALGVSVTSVPAHAEYTGFSNSANSGGGAG